eukprot:TRINITY_DN15555_c0_g2_i1.p1 TRINITY_DN15555_c0_g2~~TRINITY_DN15555_c0_g2_i1.p1  ORF type:complete len:465 (+),score=122.88 TRINITY_DN15555_c0_g2_i1:63-1457(+)
MEPVTHDFRSLEEHMKNVEPGTMLKELIQVEGVVVSIRRLSKKLFFFDIIELDSLLNGAEYKDTYLEAIVSCQTVPDLDEIQRMRRQVVTTQTTRMVGYPERNKKGVIVIHAVQLVVTHMFDTENSTGNTRAVVHNRIVDKKKDATLLKVQQFITVDQSLKKPLGGVKGPCRVPLCKVWWKGRCIKGESCNLRHSYANDAEREKFEELAMRSKAASQREVNSEDPHGEGGKFMSSKRATIFAEWIIEQYGKEGLKKGTGVLDIAGGNGAVTFEFHVKNNVPCTLVDPRPQKLVKAHRRYLRMKDKERRTDEAKAVQNEEEEEEDVGFDIFNTEGDQAEEAAESAEPVTSGLVPDQAFLPHAQQLLDEEFTTTELFKNSSLLVGMHPDQATDIIVDSALAHSKPFVIAPCCIFAHMFPSRRDPGGEPVRTYNQYVEWLIAKDPKNIKTAYLPFEGRNKVLYRLPL